MYLYKYVLCIVIPPISTAYTHFPLYVNVAPQRSSKPFPSLLKPMASSVRLSFSGEKIVTIHLIYVPHDFVYLYYTGHHSSCYLV